MPLIVNTRIMDKHMTGVQRYTQEILERLSIPFRSVSPGSQFSAGIKGHTWEQLSLPFKVKKGELLWSPSNTGPLLVSHQVVTIHDIVPIDHPEWLSKKFAQWYQFLLPKLAKRCVHILTDSEFSKSRIIDALCVPEKKVTIAKVGVSDKYKPIGESVILQMKQELKLPETPYILSLGSLEPRKNLVTLLKAWKLAQPYIGDVKLVISGARGFQRVFGDCQDSFDDIPNVIYTGHVKDELLPALYSGALMFFYLSSYEGFGLPPLEAMACGAPVCVGNQTSVPEVVGKAGILVNPFDVDAVVDVMKTVISGELNTSLYREAGLQQAKRFGWDEVVAKTARVFDQYLEL